MLGKAIYPSPDLIFRAFAETPLDKVRVLIIGQDPYHGEGEACGLAFSVNPGTRIPPSLRNIFQVRENEPVRPGAQSLCQYSVAPVQELEDDPGVQFERPSPANGDLSPWAKQVKLSKIWPCNHQAQSSACPFFGFRADRGPRAQGVLLLNTALTVRAGEPMSHRSYGWHDFTDAVIMRLSVERRSPSWPS